MTRGIGSDDGREVSLLAIDQYRRQVAWIPVVTQEEQQDLIVRIERGKAEQQQASPDAAVLADARGARDRFIEGMQRLVIFKVQQWFPRFRHVEWLDLVQEANVALLRMVDHSDLATIAEMGAFAAACMCRAFYHVLRHDGLLHVSGKVVDEVRTLRGAQMRLAGELGREPTTSEVAARMGLSEEQVRGLEVAAHEGWVDSLQALTADDEEEDRLGFVGLYERAVQQEETRRAWLAERVREAVESVLTDRQREVVELRYGLVEADEQERSYQQIASQTGKCAQVVWKLEAKAKKRLHRVLAPMLEGQEEGQVA